MKNVMVEACDDASSSITISYGDHVQGCSERNGVESEFDPEPYRFRIFAFVARLAGLVEDSDFARVDRNSPGSKLDVQRIGDEYVVDAILFIEPSAKRNRLKTVFVTLTLKTPPPCGLGTFAMPDDVAETIRAIDGVVPRFNKAGARKP